MTAPSTLVIDDEPGFTASLVAAFRARQLGLDTAATWEEGLRAFRVGLHELVLADYNLPGSKHGLKLLLDIRTLHPSSRLLLISGAVTPTAAESLAAGDLVDRFLSKGSTTIDELVEEGLAAEARSNAPTDWRRAGSAHLTRRNIDDSAIEAVDAAMRVRLT